MGKLKKIILFGNTPESLISFRGSLLKSFVDLGHEVYAISSTCNETQKQAIEDLGVKYCEIPFSRTGLNPFSDLKTIKSVYKVFKMIQPDILVSYALKPIFYGSLVAKYFKVRHFPILVGLGYTAGYIFSKEFKVLLKGKLIWPIISFFYRYSLSSSEKIFVYNKDIVSLFVKKGLIRSVKKTVLVNGSGVDVDHFYQSIPPKEISFLLIARLLSDKGLYEYVSAAEILKSKYKNISFKIVGFIDEENPAAIKKDTLKKWIKDGLIEYLGKFEDVRPAIVDSSVYVLPSYHEGIPRSILEAMSMAKPIITTDTYGCRETVNEGVNGFLVPIKDSLSLARAMEKFIKEPNLIKSMGYESRKMAEDLFEASKINKIIIKNIGLANIS